VIKDDLSSFFGDEKMDNGKPEPFIYLLIHYMNKRGIRIPFFVLMQIVVEDERMNPFIKEMKRRKKMETMNRRNVFEKI
jgi:hypothetical protein